VLDKTGIIRIVHQHYTLNKLQQNDTNSSLVISIIYSLVVENTIQLCTTLDYHSHIHITCTYQDQEHNAYPVLLFDRGDQYTPQTIQQQLQKRELKIWLLLQYIKIVFLFTYMLHCTKQTRPKFGLHLIQSLQISTCKTQRV
jgi:hypothetical protein